MGNIDFVDLLFGFRGRINRAKYWIAVVIYIGAWIVVGGIAWSLLLTSYILAAILFGLVFIVSVVSGIAVGIKRLHDRDKSGWWLLLFFLAPAVLDGIGRSLDGIGFILSLAGFAISIWAIVELGFLRGTSGSNQYGPDPLEGRI
jgi:uncharacterized membrane protein YhaH (DUF805 family)